MYSYLFGENDEQLKLKKDKVEFKKKVSKLEQEYIKLENQKIHLEKEKEELKVKLAQLDKDRGELENDIDEFEENNLFLQAERENLEYEIRVFRSKEKSFYKQILSESDTNENIIENSPKHTKWCGKRIVFNYEDEDDNSELSVTSVNNCESDKSGIYSDCEYYEKDCNNLSYLNQGRRDKTVSETEVYNIGKENKVKRQFASDIDDNCSTISGHSF